MSLKQFDSTGALAVQNQKRWFFSTTGRGPIPAHEAFKARFGFSWHFWHPKRFEGCVIL